MNPHGKAVLEKLVTRRPIFMCGCGCPGNVTMGRAPCDPLCCPDHGCTEPQYELGWLNQAEYESLQSLAQSLAEECETPSLQERIDGIKKVARILISDIAGTATEQIKTMQVHLHRVSDGNCSLNGDKCNIGSAPTLRNTSIDGYIAIKPSDMKTSIHKNQKCHTLKNATNVRFISISGEAASFFTRCRFCQ